MTAPAAIEAMSPAERRTIAQEAFAVQWRHLWADSPFYRAKLAGAGFSEDSPAPPLERLHELPFTVKSEIRDSLVEHPPLGAHLAVDPARLRQIHTSAGTTGHPSLVGLTRRDSDDWVEILRRGYVAVGHRPGDTVLHALSMSQAWVGGLPMVEAIDAAGATILPIGAEAGTERILRMMRILRPTVLQCTPGFALHLAERATAEDLDATALGVRHLLVGGEPGGGVPETRARISRAWGAPVREVMGGTDIACLLWAECEREDGMHFMAPEHVHFELVDPDSGEPVAVEDGAEGELVYSHLRREASPVLRFRHRDLVRVLGTARCACGRTTPRIRCFSRTDDMLIVKGVNLFPTSIQSALGELEGIGPDFRIVRAAGEYSLPGPVTVRVEADDDPPLSADALADRLRERLACRFEVTYVPRGTLVVPGSHKSRFFEELPR